MMLGAQYDQVCNSLIKRSGSKVVVNKYLDVPAEAERHTQSRRRDGHAPIVFVWYRAPIDAHCFGGLYHSANAGTRAHTNCSATQT